MNASERIAAAARAAQHIADAALDGELGASSPGVDTAIRHAVVGELGALLADVLPAIAGQLAPGDIAAILGDLAPVIERYAQRIAAAVVGELAPVDVDADSVVIDLP